VPSACTGNQLLGCGSRTCALGCASTAPPHCFALAPSNGITIDLLAGATATLTDASLAFDTDTGAIAGARDPGNGVVAGIGFYIVDEMGVFVVQSAAVPASTTWVAHGANGFVLFAADTIDVAGTIDVGAVADASGPHATRGGAGSTRAPCEGQNGPYKFSLPAGAGAGGGGGATSGGNGADTAPDMAGSTSGGPGGTSCAQPSTTPLRGGNGGGAGGTENFMVLGGAGGGGGGAIALVAMTSITIDGAVAAPGAGGATIANGSGGGGGGGGGAVFLESLDVTVRGALTANGGGGGPASNASPMPASGQRGHLADAMPAAGGTNAGAGGAGTTAPTSGQTATAGGGGGGAVGTIEIRSVRSSVSAATLSPAARGSTAALQ